MFEYSLLRAEVQIFLLLTLLKFIFCGIEGILWDVWRATKFLQLSEVEEGSLYIGGTCLCLCKPVMHCSYAPRWSTVLGGDEWKVCLFIIVRQFSFGTKGWSLCCNALPLASALTFNAREAVQWTERKLRFNSIQRFTVVQPKKIEGRGTMCFAWTEL